MTSYQHDPRVPTEDGGVMFVCPPPPRDTLSLDTILGVGFGVVAVERDDEAVWMGDSWTKKLRSVEREARRSPDSKWSVTFEGPLSGAVYERRGRDEWVLVKRLDGFA